MVKTHPIGSGFDAERTALSACSSSPAVAPFTPKLVFTSIQSRSLVVQPRCATTLYDAPFSMRLFVGAVRAALVVLPFFHDTRRFVHGDISPSNALVPTEDGDTVLWNDFGGSVKIGSTPICFTQVFASLTFARVCLSVTCSLLRLLCLTLGLCVAGVCLFQPNADLRMVPVLPFFFVMRAFVSLSSSMTFCGRMCATIGRHCSSRSCTSVTPILRVSDGICLGRTSLIAM